MENRQLELIALPAKNKEIFRGNGSKPQRPIKPVVFRQHHDGTASVRVDGHWHHGQVLDRRLYLSLPGAIRKQVMRWAVKHEYRDGTPRISGSVIVVTGRRKG
jgi:hypothetical protein